MADEREQSIEAELRLKFPAADVAQIKLAAEQVARLRKEIEELNKASEKSGRTATQAGGTGPSGAGATSSQQRQGAIDEAWAKRQLGKQAGRMGGGAANAGVPLSPPSPVSGGPTGGSPVGMGSTGSSGTVWQLLGIVNGRTAMIAGPFSTQQMGEMIKKGTVLTTTPVSKANGNGLGGGTGQAGSFPELKQFFTTVGTGGSAATGAGRTGTTTTPSPTPPPGGGAGATSSPGTAGAKMGGGGIPGGGANVTWFLLSGSGPFSTPQMGELIKKGTVLPITIVIKADANGLGVNGQAGSFPELKQFFSTVKVGSTGVPITSVPFPGSVPPGNTQTHLNPTRIPFPGQHSSANYAPRDPHSQTMGVPWNPYNGPPGGAGGGGGGRNGYSTRRDGAYEFINGHPVWAADRFLKFGGKLAGGVALGVGATYGAASAGNAAWLADVRGQTGADASRAALESNWFTRQFVGGYDTLSNRSGLMAQVGIQSQRAEVAQQLRMQLGGNLSTTDAQGRAVNLGRTTGSFERDWEARKLGVQSQIDAYRQDPRAATLPYYDRSTVASEVAFREAQARQPIRERGIELNRERLAIGNETAGTEAALARTKDELKRLNTARNQASLRASSEKQLAGYGDKWWIDRQVGAVQGAVGGFLPGAAKSDAARATALDEEKRIIAEITALEETRKQQDDKLVALGEKKAQNAKEEKQNKLEFIQLNARELAQRADKAEGQAGNIGQMTPLERQMNLNYLKAFLSTEDKSQLPAEVIAGARKLAPGTVDKAFVEFGAKDAGFLSELQKVAPGEYRDINLPAARKAAQDAANEAIREKPKIELGFLEDFKKFTLNDDVKKEFQDVLKAINDNVNKEITRQLLEFRQGNKQ